MQGWPQEIGKRPPRAYKIGVGHPSIAAGYDLLETRRRRTLRKRRHRADKTRVLFMHKEGNECHF